MDPAAARPNKADSRRNAAQGVGSLDEPTILDGHAHPDVCRPPEVRGELNQTPIALRQDLKRVPMGGTHSLEHSSDVRRRDLLVEQVAHRVDEDRLWLAPAKRSIETFGPNPQVEALLVSMSRDATPTLRERLRVAVRTTRRNLSAPGHRIPRRLGPVDTAALRHYRDILAGPSDTCAEHVFVLGDQQAPRCRTTARTSAVAPIASDSATSNDVGFEPRGRRLPPRACSRTASRLAMLTACRSRDRRTARREAARHGLPRRGMKMLSWRLCPALAVDSANPGQGALLGERRPEFRS